MIHKFCVTHVQVDVSFPADTYIVHLGKRIVSHFYKNQIKVSELYDDLDTFHSMLGGSAGSFAINRFLKKHPDVFKDGDIINLFQYKKFVLRGAYGKPSAVYPGISNLTFEDLAGMDLSSLLDDSVSDFLVGRPLLFKNGLFHQYQTCHPIQDFLNFTALALDLEVLAPTEVKNFFETKIFIPCGAEFGLMPVRVYKEIVSKLELVCLEFLKKHKPSSLDVYNRRAVSFCSERLGSYLLLKLFKNLPMNQEYFNGVIHNVSVDGEYRPGRD